MSTQREKRLIRDGSICENAHAFADPAVRTASDAQALGSKRCPQWGPCQAGQFNRDGLVCAAHLGISVARYVADGSTLEREAADLRGADLFKPGNNKGFFDPYAEGPLKIITDADGAHQVVMTWARTILQGPDAGDEAVVLTEEPLPDFLELAARARVPGGGIDMLAIEAAGARSTRSNGGIPCDTSRGPCRCGAWH